MAEEGKEMGRDWCQYCGVKFREHDIIEVMAGLPYHHDCAEADRDYIDRAAAHFEALARIPLQEASEKDPT